VRNRTAPRARAQRHGERYGEAENPGQKKPLRALEGNGRHEQTQTADLYRLKGQISYTLNNFHASSQRESTEKSPQDERLTVLEDFGHGASSSKFTNCFGVSPSLNPQGVSSTPVVF